MHNAGFFYKGTGSNVASGIRLTGKSANCVTQKMPTKQLGNILNPIAGGDLGDIIRRARDMGELTDVLARALPADHAGAVVAANVRETGELVVIAASSAWASRLRYETETLLEAAKSAGVTAKTCRIRVSQS